MGVKNTPAPKIHLNRVAQESAQVYAAGLIEACAAKADPLEVITESDRFPQITKGSEVEYMIGWFHGVAETLGVHVEVLWAEFAPPPMKDGNPKPARKRQKAA